MDEIASGKASGPLTKSEMDSKYGVGSWRASRRFLIFQPQHDKHRAIDNNLGSYVNEAAEVLESLQTSSFDKAIRVALRVSEASGAPMQDAWQLVLGAEDMDAAYRAVPVHHNHIPYCISALLCTKSKQVKFVSFNALLFGQTAAVNNFNRIPAFICAVAARVSACMVWHYFDDFGCVDFEA
eukprot:11264121-Karenia_brevis.AAC.1